MTLSKTVALRPDKRASIGGGHMLAAPLKLVTLSPVQMR